MKDLLCVKDITFCNSGAVVLVLLLKDDLEEEEEEEGPEDDGDDNGRGEGKAEEPLEEARLEKTYIFGGFQDIFWGLLNKS